MLAAMNRFVLTPEYEHAMAISPISYFVEPGLSSYKESERIPLQNRIEYRLFLCAYHLAGDGRITNLIYKVSVSL